MTTEARPIALVTGGGVGIGAACCRELASAGFAVAIHYNSSEGPARELAAELPGAFTLRADLARTEEVDALAKRIAEQGRLEVLVNNAGITVDAPLFSASPEDLDRMLATNLKSAWLLTKRLSRLMIRARKGAIVNMSSVVGSTGNPGQAGYGITKAAIESLTRTAAQELASYGIRVNAVAPGFTRTRMTDALPPEHQSAALALVPLGRMAEPEEIARAVRFLALEATYCTGIVLHANGGMYMG